MIDEIDEWRAAEQMRKMYQADAARIAATRADALMDQGDVDGFKAWRRIVEKIHQLDRSNPASDEALH